MTSMSVNCCSPALNFGRNEKRYAVKKSDAHRAAERSGGRQTPRQAETMLWQRRAAHKS